MHSLLYNLHVMSLVFNVEKNAVLFIAQIPVLQFKLLKLMFVLRGTWAYKIPKDISANIDILVRSGICKSFRK